MVASRLLWRRVRDTDGRFVGRIYDLLGERRGDELRVTALLVGRHSLLVRFGWGLGRGDSISWDRVVQLEPEVVVRPEAGHR
jgi:sporulation protein YlmC with PRC-barrel domain